MARFPIEAFGNDILKFSWPIIHNYQQNNKLLISVWKLVRPLQEKSMNKAIIKTSQKGWLEELAKAYKDKLPVTVIDDAEVGINHTLPEQRPVGPGK